MKKWISSALLCSSLALTACGGGSSTSNAEATGSGDSAANQTKTVRVAMNAEFAPFEFTTSNGEYTGFDIDLMKAMGKAGNFNVEFKHQPWDGLFALLETGDADALISAVTITEDRKKSFDFLEPYFEIQQVILVPQGKKATNIEELKGLNRIGVVTGNTGDLVATKIFGPSSPKVARFESLPIVFKELENNGVDAIISDSAVVDHYLKNNADKGFTKFEAKDFDKEYYGIAVRKGNTEMATLLNDSLKKVRDSGEYDTIYKKYFVTK